MTYINMVNPKGHEYPEVGIDMSYLSEKGLCHLAGGTF